MVVDLVEVEEEPLELVLRKRPSYCQPPEDGGSLLAEPLAFGLALPAEPPLLLFVE